MKQEKNRESESLSRVKEILFGDDLQNLAERLKEIKNDYSSKLEEQNIHFAEAIDKLTLETDTKNQSVSKLLEEQKKKAETLTSQIDTRIKQLEKTINAVQAKFEIRSKEFLQRASEAASVSTNALKEEMIKSIDELRNTKVDKSEMAELFGMVIKKLK